MSKRNWWAEYKRLREAVKRLQETEYTITREGDPNHNHNFEEWELVSDSGIVFCDWKCSCGLEVSQLIGERLRPLKIPEDQSRQTTWRE